MGLINIATEWFFTVSLALFAAIQGPWFIELQPHDQQWMIQGKVEFPASSTPLMK